MFIITDEIIAYGHPNIQGTHKTTFEITKENYLTKKGTCIIGIRANKGAADLSERFKKATRSKCRVKLILIVDQYVEEIYGVGHPNLTFKDESDIVIRKSSYTCPRTIMINANKAAADINREIIKILKNKNSCVTIRLAIEK